MLELLVVGLIGICLLAAMGVVAAILWLVFLPFRLLGLVFKGLAALLFLPLFGLVALVLAAAVGLPLFLLVAVPLLPFVLLFLFIVWLSKRGVRHVSPTG